MLLHEFDLLNKNFDLVFHFFSEVQTISKIIDEVFKDIWIIVFGQLHQQKPISISTFSDNHGNIVRFVGPCAFDQISPSAKYETLCQMKFELLKCIPCVRKVTTHFLWTSTKCELISKCHYVLRWCWLQIFSPKYT